MKKVLITLFTIMLMMSFASAEDLSSLSLDQLNERQQKLLDELSQVNAAREAILQQTQTSVINDESLGRIIDLFPDEQLAIMIRTSCGKTSIEQPVTQKDLDEVEMLTCVFDEFHDFTGIRYLRNLWYFHTEDNYSGPFPEELRYCHSLTSLYLNSNPNITEIPEWIGELTNLETLEFYHDDITYLPDSVCNLMKLTHLDVSRNEKLAILPENIGNLAKLDYLNISQTAITMLPASVRNLSLSYFGMNDLPIK